MASVSIQHLARGDIDEAYVLARLCDARLTLKAWRLRVLARNAEPSAGGVLLARDARARPCGLVVYVMTDQPDGRRSLQIEQLVGFDVLDPRPVASALITEAVRLSRVAGCETLCLIRPLGPSVEVAAQVFATGVAVLPSLFASALPADRPTPAFDPGQERRPAGLVH